MVASEHCKENAIAGVPVQVHSDFPKGAFCIVYQRDDTADGWSQTRKYAMEGFFTTQR